MTIFIILTLVYCLRYNHIRSNLRLLIFSLIFVFSQKGMAVGVVPCQNLGFPVGPFNNVICLYSSFFFGWVICFKRRRNVCFPKWPKYFILLLPFLVIEYYVTTNTISNAFWVPVFIFSQLSFYIFVIQSKYTKEELFEALYEVCFIWCLLEFFLTLLYPVFGFSQAISWFYDFASNQSARREGFASAVGTFGHPANLAYFCSFLAFYFFYSYLASYRRRKSFVLLLMCLFVIFFTYSRTSYVIVLGGLFVVYYLYQNERVSFKAMFYVLIMFVAFYLLSFVPTIHKVFFESDMNEMYEARLLHWTVALDLHKMRPLLGWGINTDVYVMYSQYPYLPDFIKTNPIHNTHLIVLVEAGIVGLIIWIFGHLSLLIYGLKRLSHSDMYSKYGCILAIVGLLYEFSYGFTGWSFFGFVHTPCIIISLLLLEERVKR